MNEEIIAYKCMLLLLATLIINIFHLLSEIQYIIIFENVFFAVYYKYFHTEFNHIKIFFI